jgi:hypothetical protein
VLTAGQSTAGCRGRNHATSLAGPQLGCCRRTNQRCDLGIDAVRAVMRRPTPLAQPVGAGRLIAPEPLVAGLPADPIALAEFHHRIQVPFPVRDEPHALCHGRCLPPRHAHLPREQPRWCHPCSRSDVLPMYPVCTSRVSNRPLERAGMTPRRPSGSASAGRSTPGR